MKMAEVLHHLVENSQAFDAPGKVEAHKAISESLKEDERHYSVPSPEAEQATADDKAAKRAELKAQLAALEDTPAEDESEDADETKAE